MSKFCKAYNKLMDLEGGYLKDMDGETYCGVVRRFHPHLKLWDFVDREKPLRNGEFLNNRRVRTLLMLFYLQNYWDDRFELIDCQKTVTFIFSQYVNMGVKAILMAQEVAGVKQDGIIGEITAAAINNDCSFLNRLKKRNISYYEAVVLNQPEKRIYLQGWKNRVDALLA